MKLAPITPTIYLSDDDEQIYGYLSSVDRRVDAYVAPTGDLTKPGIGWKRLAAPADSVYDFYKLGNRMFLYSVKGAPNGQILVTGTASPNPATATVLLPEGKRTSPALFPPKTCCS